MEPHDSFDSVPNDATVEWLFRAGGSGLDGFALSVPDTAQTCFATSTMPPGAQVEVGAGRQVVTGPFSLSTLEACD